MSDPKPVKSLGNTKEHEVSTVSTHPGCDKKIVLIWKCLYRPEAAAGEITHTYYHH